MNLKIRSLVLFRNLLTCEPLRSLASLLAANPADRPALCDAYASVCRALLPFGLDWTDALEDALMRDENDALASVLRGEELSPLIADRMERELETLEAVCRLDARPYLELLPEADLPAWNSGKADLVSFYKEYLRRIPQKGYGMFARYGSFCLSEDGELVPVKNPDPQTLSDLVGYGREKEQILDNVDGFLKGLPANNIFLYGDAGTGKSSTLKAVANAFFDRGLRLVEVKQNQLYLIPALMDHLSDNPLKFLLFIDDVLFSSDDRDFCALKAMLEGGVSSRGEKILICVTSNYRHLVQERESDRVGDELHVSDKIQELMSLSARFGLMVTFQRPDRELYGQIVLELARKAGLAYGESELLRKAEAFALRAGGRTPRAACQFIRMMNLEQEKK